MKPDTPSAECAGLLDRVGLSAARPSVSVSQREPTPDRPIVVNLLERHEFSSQTFIPIDVDRWLIVVAPHAACGFFRAVSVMYPAADVAQMIAAPVVVQVLEGENAVMVNRKLMGATNPKDADPGTIRADFANRLLSHRRFTDAIQDADVDRKSVV